VSNDIIVTIHQPNFIPWYPFFQKMKQADIFVMLTHCQFEKNGFTNRFNIDGAWKTMSVYRGLRPINEKTYVNPLKDWNKIKASLPAYSSQLQLFDDCISDSLVKTNIAIIHKIVDVLEINTKIVIDYKTPLVGTERLVDICQHYGASKYLSGLGGKDYLDEAAFANNAIALTYQNEADMIKKSVLEVLKDNG
tara:strand:+ start:41 stop:619 length:579 start_codon:yes stop_codon:yes gene_type:complete